MMNTIHTKTHTRADQYIPSYRRPPSPSLSFLFPSPNAKNTIYLSGISGDSRGQFFFRVLWSCNVRYKHACKFPNLPYILNPAWLSNGTTRRHTLVGYVCMCCYGQNVLSSIIMLFSFTDPVILTHKSD